jgi:hypothetical protein
LQVQSKPIGIHSGLQCLLDLESREDPNSNHSPNDEALRSWRV